jgi:hypothetical protein
MILAGYPPDTHWVSQEQRKIKKIALIFMLGNAFEMGDFLK